MSGTTITATVMVSVQSKILPGLLRRRVDHVEFFVLLFKFFDGLVRYVTS
jgi:hypothetical protein